MSEIQDIAAEIAKLPAETLEEVRKVLGLAEGAEVKPEHVEAAAPEAVAKVTEVVDDAAKAVEAAAPVVADVAKDAAEVVPAVAPEAAAVEDVAKVAEKVAPDAEKVSALLRDLRINPTTDTIGKITAAFLDWSKA